MGFGIYQTAAFLLTSCVLSGNLLTLSSLFPYLVNKVCLAGSWEV